VERLGIIGLGNPGYEYANTRHNVGFMVVDYLQNFYKFPSYQKTNFNLLTFGKISNTKVYLVKPQTYMNLSGIGVKEFIEKFAFAPEELLVIHDDLDLPIGTIRIKFNGKDGGHNGIKSIIKEINTSNFYRLRIGIGKPQDKNQIVEYVLGKFNEDELKTIEKILQSSHQIIETIIKEGWDKAQNLYNRKCLFC
jgi:PTH1 family peptidyl-tRNA hydrolase